MSKKVIIPKESLGPINTYTRRYDVRYRIVSEDRNRFSAWSNIYSANPEIIYEPGNFDIRGQIKLEKIGSSYVGITFDPVSIYKKTENNSLRLINEVSSYDVWLKWAGSGGDNPGEWFYKERIRSTSLNVIIPSQYPYIDVNGDVDYGTPRVLYVEVYRPTRPPLRYEETRTFSQEENLVDTVNNQLNFPTGHGTITATPGLYLSDTPIGGLSDDTTYYTRTIDYYSISLHPTRQDALDDTNRIDLTGTPSGTGSFTGFTFRIYESEITNL